MEISPVMNNFEKIAVVFGFISGVTVMLIGMRRGRFPMVGSIFNEKYTLSLDKLDKVLAYCSLIFFILCMVFLALSFSQS
ncbi:MAG: hypothetical protein NTW42_05150 [Deltaproteobacteria bacterium]|nr:hypothetical protein [Deltaproteobacteria bacterium]